MNYNAATPFYNHYKNSPGALAASVDNCEYTYKELAAHAQKISLWLQNSLRRRPARVGILATRSIEACSAILGICWAGGCYVPISLKLPEDRLRAVFSLADLDALITDPQGAALLTKTLLPAAPAHILVPGGVYVSGRAVTHFNDLPETGYAHEPTDKKAGELAYIIFTSGSTGVPKGVSIPAGALRQYCDAMQQLYHFTPEDRISETADISFDLSVGNMFMTWHAGASLHIVPAAESLSPLKFIQNHRLSVWFSVPSVISFMQKMRQLRPGVFPSLRYSLFIGEPLPHSAAEAWQAAAPDSIVENLYGPTEATVACTRQKLADIPPASKRENVSIGAAFAGTEAAIFSEDLQIQPANVQGELALAGLQLATGYYNQPALTAKRFPVINGKRWYLTGDAAVYDSNGLLHHLGRIDNQVKVLGYRVELEDIETHLRKAAGVALAVAVPWPLLNGAAVGTVGFVSGAAVAPERIRETLAEKLPAYMVPGDIHDIPQIPLTPNGKVDRKALKEMLQNGKAGL